MKKHLCTILLAISVVWVAMVLHLDPAHVYAQSIGSNNGVVGQGGSGGGSGCTTSGSAILKGNGSGGCSNASAGTDYAPATSGTSILKGNGSGSFANAASGTDYAPATSGTSILKGNGAGAFANAASGTDYAPATSGSSILKGNGSGGFSNAASGTDYAPATSGSAILKGNGSGGFSSATSGTDYAPATSGSNVLLGNGSGGFSSLSGNSLSSHNFANSISAAGVISGARPASTDLSDLPIPVSSGGTQCGAPTTFASLPGSPTNGEICNVTDASACAAGTAVTAGGGSTKCQVTYNGTNWMPAGGASSSGGPPSGSASGDLSGSYPGPTVAKVNGAAVPTSATLLGSNSSGQLTSTSVPLTVANGGTQCGAPTTFASLPGSPTNGEICNVTDASACAAGTAVTAGGGATKCQVTYNGTNWMPAGGASGGSGSPSSPNNAVQKDASGAFGAAAMNDNGTSGNNLPSYSPEGGNSTGTILSLNPTGTMSWNPDVTDTTPATFKANLNNVNTAGWLDPAAFGAQFLNTTATFSSSSGTTVNTTAIHDFMPNAGVYIPHGGSAESIGGVALSSITVPAPTINYDYCDQGASFALTHSTSQSAGIDGGLFFQANMEPLVNETGQAHQGTYSYSGGVYTVNALSGDIPMVSCYAMATPTATPASTIAVEAVLLGAVTGSAPPKWQGGMTAASAAGSLTAAWILPTSTHPAEVTMQIPGYQASHSYSAGTLIQPLDSTAYGAWPGATTAVSANTLILVTSNIPPNGGVFQATTGGTTGSSQPTWSSLTAGCPNFGDTCSDGSVVWTNRGRGPLYVVTTAGTSGTEPAFGNASTGCPTIGATCSSTAVFTDIGAVGQSGGPAGWAFWEATCTGTSCTLGSYFLDRIVWGNERQIDLGTSAQYAGYGFLDWGTYVAGAEDIPATPPASAQNDDFYSTVSSVPSGTSMVLAAAPNSSCASGGCSLIYHDDTPAMNALQTYCANQTGNGVANATCRARIRPGTLRLSVFRETNLDAVEGQDYYTSRILMFGSPGSYSVTGQAIGGQWQNFSTGGDFRSRNVAIWTDNTGGDAIVHNDLHWTPVDVVQTWFAGTSAYIRRGFQMDSGGGRYEAIHSINLMNDFTCGNCNGFTVGPGYNVYQMDWPGRLLYPAIMYEKFAMGPMTFLGVTGENTWNLIGPGNASAAGGGGQATGFNVLGSIVDDFAEADNTPSEDNTLIKNAVGSVCTGTNTPFAGCVGAGNPAGGSVNPIGTLFVLNGNGDNNYIGPQGDFTINSTINMAEGCVWGQGTSSTRISVSGMDCPTGAFGVISQAASDVENSSFGNIYSAQSNSLCTAMDEPWACCTGSGTGICNNPWSGIGISSEVPGSVDAGNIIVGTSGGSGITGHLIGYQESQTSGTGFPACNANGDPIWLRENTGSAWETNLNTALNVCSTTNVQSAYHLTTATSTASGSGDTLTPVRNFQCTNQEVTMSAADTITLHNASYANQCEIVRVCQNGTGGFTPTFSASGGPTVTGSFPTCTTTANKCCDFELIFDSPSTAYVSGANGGPL